jgi:hypothetical protein
LNKYVRVVGFASIAAVDVRVVGFASIAAVEE